MVPDKTVLSYFKILADGTTVTHANCYTYYKFYLIRCINACYKSISITNETLVLLGIVVYQLTSMNEKLKIFCR